MIFTQAPALYSGSFTQSAPITAATHAGYGNGIFILAGNSKGWKSIDNGATWTGPYAATGLGNTLTTSYGLGGIKWAGNQFTDIGNMSTRVTSPDGGGWTSQTVVSNVAGDIAGDTWAISPDGVIMMVPKYNNISGVTTGFIILSLNSGANWSRDTVLSACWTAVATNGTGRYVVVANTDANATTTSVRAAYTDNATKAGGLPGWTEVTGLAKINNAAIVGYNDVAYANGMWLTVGKAIISRSADGITWTNVDLSGLLNVQYYGIAYGNGKWVVGVVTSALTFQFLTSTDAITWSLDPVVRNKNANVYINIVFGNGVFLAACGGSNYAVFT